MQNNMVELMQFGEAPAGDIVCRWSRLAQAQLAHSRSPMKSA
jgi:hypothetical protein